VIIELFSGNGEIERFLSEIDDLFVVSDLIVCELYKGAYLSSNPEKGEKEIEKFLENVRILESGSRAVKTFGKLNERYPNQNDFDLMVASVCVAEDAEFLTKDDDFESIEELEKKVV